MNFELSLSFGGIFCYILILAITVPLRLSIVSSSYSMPPSCLSSVVLYPAALPGPGLTAWVLLHVGAVQVACNREAGVRTM